MGTLHTVGRVGEWADGEGRPVRVGNRVIAVFRVGDSFFAIDDMCPHMGASLSCGFVEDGIVTCPWHFWRFRLRDGAWADNPRIKTDHYPVHVAGDEVQIEIAD